LWRDFGSSRRFHISKFSRFFVLTVLTDGGFCALILGGIAGLWIDNMGLGIILTVSLMCNMLWASFAGTLFPIIISRFGLDPAISAGPILTTTTDVLGYALFLGLATLFLI